MLRAGQTDGKSYRAGVPIWLRDTATSFLARVTRRFGYRTDYA